MKRLGRGRFVAIKSKVTARDGLVFYRVAVTRRTSGWLQREAVATPRRPGDDKRLYRLIVASDEFDRIARARIFLETFRQSRLRPEILLILAEAAESAAQKLSRDAKRRLDADPTIGKEAPEFSYYLNYSGLDRYNRQGVRFVFDPQTKSFHYDGSAWREILRRYPRSPEANEARRLAVAYRNRLRQVAP